MGTITVKDGTTIYYKDCTGHNATSIIAALCRNS